MSKQTKEDLKFKLIMIIVFLGIIAIAMCYCRARTGNVRIETGTVTDKGIKRDGEDSDIYLIYTKDTAGESNVFCIQDTLVHGRWNSSDLYAKIEVGKTYNFEICGSRVTFFSWYPNILSIQEVK